jgi:uncharacterized small protein (DUF1192 family)
MQEAGLVMTIFSIVSVFCTVLGSLVMLGALIWRLAKSVSSLESATAGLERQVQSLELLRGEVARIALLDQRTARVEADIVRHADVAERIAGLEARVERIEAEAYKKGATH